MVKKAFQWFVLSGVMMWGFSLTAHAQVGQLTQHTFELLAFSEDGKLFVLKTSDDHERLSFQVRDSRKGKIVDTAHFEEGDEKKAWRRIQRKHKLRADPSESAENERLGVTLVTAQKGKKLRVYVMKGERVRSYSKVKLLPVPGDESKVASSNVKQLVWGPKGKHVIMIYHQKLKTPHLWEGDFVYAMKFKAYKANFDE